MKLSYKLLLVIALITLGCIGTAVVLIYTSIRSALQDQVTSHQLEAASGILLQADIFLYDRTIELRGLTTQEQVQRFITSRITASTTATAAADLEAYRKLTDNWSKLSILDLNGVVKATTNSAESGQSLPSRNPHLNEWYEQAKTGQTVTSDAYRTSDNHQPTMAYFAPIQSNGRVVGVVEGEIIWSTLLDLIHGPKDSTAQLINAQGLSLGSNQVHSLDEVLVKDYHAQPTFKQVASDSTGSVIGPSLTNSKETALTTHVAEAGWRDYKGHGWRLIIERPTRVAFAPARQLTLLLLGAILITASIGIVIILILINRFAISPIRAISAAVARVTVGDLTQTVPVTTKDELGTLGRNFNEMTYQLAVTHRSLKASTAAAEQALAQLESSINGLRQGFILTDSKGQPLMVNAAAQDLVREGTKNRRPKTVSLANIAALLPPDLKLSDQVLQTIKKRLPAKYPDLALGGRFLNLYLSPVIHEDNAIGCVLLLEDITEERILQRSRDEFFSIASHELRTPLTAIRGNTSMIQQYYSDQLKDPSLSEMVTDIHESAIRLIEIVNDFLDASRLEQGKMQFTLEAFDLTSIIEKIIYEMAGVSRDKQLYLKFEPTLKNLPLVYADQNRVKQVIYNLVGNAMKFTQKGGTTITTKVEPNKLKVFIADSGQGISPEGQQILFHKFQQSTASILTRDNTRGTGLGLYISRLLLEQMGGSVQLEHSEVGKGTTFSFTLPLATKKQLEAPKPQKDSGSSETKPV